MSIEEPGWRKTLVNRLIDRNKRDTTSFSEIITQSMFYYIEIYTYRARMANKIAPRVSFLLYGSQSLFNHFH